MPKIVTVLGRKGGVGKTCTAVHLAAYFAEQGPTLLIDGDPNRSATGWARRGELPFEVCGVAQAARRIGESEYVVMDTEAQPSREDLEDLSEGAHFLVLPSPPDVLALEVLWKTVEDLMEMGRTDGFKILLTMVPPWPSREGEQARAGLVEADLPIFEAQIRRLAAFPKAAFAGVPVYKVKDPRAWFGWKDYVRVGEEVISSL
ncbi:ParA family protein [Rubrobacter calidifluminis]|uniref:ParA family protein n=1 Tax=Rubrobacter calidifluminis TaxID=1392640 RepID=UPI002361C2C1|nr:ParA family protein [Rubrobacter calidifluminis]